MTEEILTNYFIPALVFLGERLESNFITALAGALAGAWAGAWAAQKSADKANQRKRILEEIRSTNAAIALSMTIANSFLNIKKQHVKSLKDTFDTALREFKRAEEDRKQNPNLVFKLRLDFRGLPQLALPMGPLLDLLFHKVSVSRIVIIGTNLSQCVASLNESIGHRKDVISDLQTKNLSTSDQIALYFGFETKRGLDERHPDSIKGISSLTDDCIFFSVLLSRQLHEYGKNLAKEYGKNAPSISKADFSISEKDGLIPSEELYPDWKWVITANT